MIGTQEYPQGETQPYYVALGRGSDWILRCKDCQRLVTDTIAKTGSCVCGCKTTKEIRRLSLWEWIQIRVGLIRFPHRQEFLQEFNRVR